MSRPKRVVPWQGRRSLDDAASNYIVRMCKGSSTTTPPRAVLAMPSTPIFNRFSNPSLLRAISAAARMSHATAGAPTKPPAIASRERHFMAAHKLQGPSICKNPGKAILCWFLNPASCMQYLRRPERDMPRTGPHLQLYYGDLQIWFSHGSVQDSGLATPSQS